MKQEKLEVNNIEVKPGEQKEVRLHIGKLTTGTKVFINSHIYRSENPGPTVFLQGGLHGDEINGVEIVRHLIYDGIFEDLKCGTIIAIPLVNLYGFLQYRREVPDGKDINRKFPGFETGSLASRIAYSITTNIIPNIDFGVDFHTGGADRYNYPQIRYTKGHKASRDLALQFAPPFIVPKDTIEDSFRDTCIENDIPIIVYEGGESLRLNMYSIEVAVNGIKRLLHAHDMLEIDPPVNNKVLEMKESSWIRASRGGMYEWSKSSGQEVRKSEPLGRIKDPYGNSEASIKCDEEGYIIGHNNSPLVYRGDALFNIGYDINEIDLS